MTLLQPIWLLLLVPLAFAATRWPAPPGWRRALRFISLGLLVLALCRPTLQLPRRGGHLVVVADRSASMPLDGEALEGEIIQRLEAARGADDALAVVGFGVGSILERPFAGERFSGFTGQIDSGQSNLGEALERALALAPSQGSSRILVVSDGRYTGEDPLLSGNRAALRGVPIDYRLLERPRAGDVAVERVDAPAEVSPNEGYLISAWIDTPVSQEVDIELVRGDTRIYAGRRRVPAGRSRLALRDRAMSPGVASYRLNVRGASEDPVPENNTARFLVSARGPRPVLWVSEGTGEGLGGMLRAGGLEVRKRPPEEFDGAFEDLAGFSAVVLENVAASTISELAQQRLAAWVRDAGGGLMLTGGRSSFGPGGYFRSPLDPVLPVSMELRQEHRKMALAMVVALDRSGSMAAPVAGGRTKMDLANLATVEVLELLSPLDEFGVVAVDSQPHLVVPLAPLTNPEAIRHDVLRINSMGGGIFVYEGLHAAAEQLLRARAGSRHILLFADANDAENPAAYVELLNRCRAAGITVSVVGLGKPTDADAGLLRDIARRGDGRAFFTESAQELPRLFAQDTFVVSRSAFVDEETAVRFTPVLASLTGRSLPAPPSVGGYNLTYLRPGADLGGVTTDDNQAPLVASWQVGLGRALAYTGEVDGQFSGSIAGWSEYGDLLTSLVRWTAGDEGKLGDDMLLTREVVGGQVRVRLHLDPEREADPFVGSPVVTTLLGLPGKEPESKSSSLSWIDPDTMEMTVPIHGDEVALVTVDVPGIGAETLSPVRLPYSPELAPDDSDRARRTLERLARVTGGKQRLEVGELWNEFPRRPRLVEITPWLLALAIVLFLAEVLERRSGILSLGTSRWIRREAEAATSGRPGPRRASRARRRVGPAQPRRQDQPAAAESDRPTEPASSEEPEKAPDVFDALAEARRRSRRRTSR